MTDPIFPLPGATQGLAFLDLGERLRQRGQLEAASTVALAGLGRYPTLPDAHDLLARIRADEGEDAPAIASWRAALELAPGHVGALKGLAFLAYRARDLATAERHLEAAAMHSPHDVTIIAALDRIRSTIPSPSSETFQLDSLASGLLLVDAQGMRLTGGVGPGSGEAEADASAAEASGLAREAARATRFLGLGRWQQVVMEGDETKVALVFIDEEVSLLVRRPATTPPGRLLATTTKAADAAREWLGKST